MVHLSSCKRIDGPYLWRTDGPIFKFSKNVTEMPNVYTRKQNVAPRGEWTEENLQQAICAINSGAMGICEASRSFDIPKTTLLRRIEKNNFQKRNRLGPDLNLCQLCGKHSKTKK